MTTQTPPSRTLSDYERDDIDSKNLIGVAVGGAPTARKAEPIQSPRAFTPKEVGPTGGAGAQGLAPGPTVPLYIPTENIAAHSVVCHERLMSAFGGKADMTMNGENVRF